jgi:hypothetical protein
VVQFWGPLAALAIISLQIGAVTDLVESRAGDRIARRQPHAAVGSGVDVLAAHHAGAQLIVAFLGWRASCSHLWIATGRPCTTARPNAGHLRSASLDEEDEKPGH